MSSFPPHRSTPSIPISQEIALKYLQTYLSAAKSSPYLLPNARLEPSGPTAGSSNSSVAIHNLQRVEAGLRGEWLAPSLDFEENNVKLPTGLEDTGEGDHMQVDGWQDLDEYQREQSIDEGQVGHRDTVVVKEGVSYFDDEVEDLIAGEAKGQEDVSVNGQNSKKLHDKGARKKEKKLRHKLDKAQRNEGRKKKEARE